MADTIAQQIIAVALGTYRFHPTVAAREILDTAMDGHHGQDLDFSADPVRGYDNWLQPPSPFAELLRAAFIPSLASSDLALWDDVDVEVAEAFRDFWRATVLKPFARRYKLQP